MPVLKLDLIFKLLIINCLSIFLLYLFFTDSPAPISPGVNFTKTITIDKDKDILRNRVEIALSRQINQRESNRLTAMCWAPNTAEETIAEFYKNSNNQPADLFHSLSSNLPENYFTSTIWGRTATNGLRGTTLQEVLGKPLTLTWSLVPDGTFIQAFNPSVGEVPAPSNLIAFLDNIYGCSGGANLTTRCWFSLFEDIFDRWEELTGFTYVYEPMDDGKAWTFLEIPPGVLGVRGDVRIAGHRIDGDRNVLAYNFFPNVSDMVLDTDDNFYEDTTNNSIRLRNILSHEHGHGLGMQHSCPVDNRRLMQPFISTAFDGPQEDDILGANFGYGDRFGCNDEVVEATDLGPLDAKGLFIPQVSLDAYAIVNILEEDFYKIKINQAGSFKVVVTPTGTEYLAGIQSIFTGFCGAGSPFNALKEGDLNIQIIDSDGTSVLATAESNAAGLSETLEVEVNIEKELYIRVFGATGNETQMYDLQLFFDPSPFIPTLNEWGLFIISLLIINLGVIFIYKKRIY